MHISFSVDGIIYVTVWQICAYVVNTITNPKLRVCEELVSTAHNLHLKFPIVLSSETFSLSPVIPKLFPEVVPGM